MLIQREFTPRSTPFKGKVWAEMKDQSVLRDQEEVVKDINMHDISLSLSLTHTLPKNVLNTSHVQQHTRTNADGHTPASFFYYLFLLRHHWKS